MPDYLAPQREILYALNEVLDFPSHYQTLPEGELATPDMVAAIIEQAAKFSEQVIAPLNAQADHQGCNFQAGQVTTPQGFHAAYQAFVEGGWPGLAQPEAFGGQGLPASLGSVTYEMMTSACHAWAMIPTLTWGAIKTLAAHAPIEIQQRFIPSLVAGRWSGTMCLTEAHCGSDLGLLRTRASKNDDGSYCLSGSKIFISAGEHDLTENIVHIVLARLPDAPEGVKGISLFVVPKIWVNEDGSLGESNGVTCGSIEHKMGIHGNPTCVLNFDGARGYLIGQAHRGMSAMFTFINESRLGVAQQGHGHMELSFQGALAYAKERVQMCATPRINPDKPADPIIAHADVRRMLLTQKALSEGGRLLNYYCAQQVDIAHSHPDMDARIQAQNALALLTPIAKGFITEMSLECASLGIQVLGGHGFISEWGMEQEYRDTRITAIYEGTNGIQALDLLGRKILATRGEVAQPFWQKIQEFCNEPWSEELSPLAEMLLKQVELWQSLTLAVGKKAEAGDANAVGAAAYDYLMLAGFTSLAYFLLRSAKVAEASVNSESGDLDYYQSKIDLAKFYFARLLTRNATHSANIQSETDTLMVMPVDSFAG